jgi:salicylate hydroxylase
MTDKLQIAIVGAGIGGLTAALALRARGLNVTVFERALSPREAGAGISIQPNAVRLLKRIGLHDRLENIGSRTVGLSLWTSRGEPVPTPPASADSPSYQVHRVELLDMLNDAQGKARFALGIIVPESGKQTPVYRSPSPTASPPMRISS